MKLKVLDAVIIFPLIERSGEGMGRGWEFACIWLGGPTTMWLRNYGIIKASEGFSFWNCILYGFTRMILQYAMWKEYEFAWLDVSTVSL